jgi:hypothetical protein
VTLGIVADRRRPMALWMAASFKLKISGDKIQSTTASTLTSQPNTQPIMKKLSFGIHFSWRRELKIQFFAPS